MTTSSRSDFARLFERLSSYRSTIACGTPTVDDVPATADPSDLDPVIKSLAPLVATRAHIYELKSSQYGSGETVALTSSSSIDGTASDSDNTSLSEFPMEKRYPFTFSLMVHKLYGLEEWAEMVQDVVEKSKERYRPLEQDFKSRTHAQMDDHEHLEADTAVKGETGQTFVDDVDRRDKGVAPEKSERREMDLRDRDVILKKRCIGRRKWTDESMTDEGTWVYDATVSSVEAARPAYPTPTAANVLGNPTVKNNSSSMLYTAKPAARSTPEEPLLRQSDTRAGSRNAKDIGRDMAKSPTLNEARHSKKRPFGL